MKLFLVNNIRIGDESTYVVVRASTYEDARDLCIAKFAPNDTSEWAFGFNDLGNYTELEQEGEGAVVSWLSIKEHAGVE